MAAPLQQRSTWTANRRVALIIGIVFTVIGLVGFFIAPGMAQRSLLGLDVDRVHNIVHLVTGLLGLIAAFTGWPRLFNQIFGVVYLVIGLAGLVYPAFYSHGMLFGVMHVNAVGHVFHLVVGVIAAYVGYFVHDYSRVEEPYARESQRRTY
ncbi:hypothetical protein KSD_92370 [Ktedonobacter sp. SOSP1-85]|uniref:DUF4383 domain-containing protein n=1 Tax=Ktedonobacter sp. SOSP1-85 TaxID=2778367 RepID=UPI0019164A47|nr:DUF4383 domain-containing protein [Ktedonobacter sp. SOSP1-85]GHO81466.1 hypothetical protein KSD_92370 [Ktedonobacter sp. SOSP1-85]